MSADVQAPALSLNVRRSREDKQNKGQQEDIQVESYGDEDTLKLGHADLRSHKVSKYNTTTQIFVHVWWNGEQWIAVWYSPIRRTELAAADLEMS